MKLKLLAILLALGTAAQAAVLAPDAKEAKAAHMATEQLARNHYKATPVDEALSIRIFDQYLKALDPEKLFFTQVDIDQLSEARTRLGADMLNDDLARPFAIFNLYVKRANERFGYARGLLKDGFNFETNETLQFARKKQAWAKNEAEVQDLWRKRVKNDWLRLKLAGKDDKGIVEVLGKRYDSSLKRMARLNNEDAFTTYMNAYAAAIEPHTAYMAPRAAENFNISMRLSLSGIGAVLTESGEYTTIRELVPASPASQSGQLNVGDRIVGVGQGDSGPITDITGARLDDSVALIRGAADTVVRLEVLPADAGADGKHKVVSLVRKPITLQDQAAKSSVQTVTDGKTTRSIGVITLPSFYEDWAGKQKGDANYRSTSRDVAQLLKELKEKKVDAVLMDLRNNGGGSLSEVVDLTGLFTGKGPVVQVRVANGQVQVIPATRSDAIWDGPVGVLINRNSASASEIFAAAIQDYGRGIIIGEPSFGKGTVQSVISLDRIAKTDKPLLGELRMTTAQFFRINGGTTQLRGVVPDVAFPTTADVGEYGESSLDNPLPWTQIPAANYTPRGSVREQLPILVAQHKQRIKSEKEFQYLQEDIAEYNRIRKQNNISLNEAERRKEKAAQEAKLAARKAATKGKDATRNDAADSKDDGLQAGERDVAADVAAEKARKDEKDVLLLEAAHILGDQVDLLKPGVNLAARIKQITTPGQ